MNILVILGHPEKGSFNHAIPQTTVNTLKQLNHKVIYHDLYAEKLTISQNEEKSKLIQKSIPILKNTAKNLLLQKVL